MSEPRRLAVLGSPIAHSKSPALHAAAYRELGLDWQYERIEATGDFLPDFLGGLGPEWRGLSLTMPCKRDILPLLDECDELVTMTGVANTLLLDGDTKRGFNTDVYGIARAFQEAGVERLESVQVLGGGATAASAIAAVAGLGADRVTVCVRTPEGSTALVELGVQLGLRVEIVRLGDALDHLPGAVISTIPNGVDARLEFSPEVRRNAALFDVAYEPWPTSLAHGWLAEGGTVLSGLDMLLHQALMQVRIFMLGDPLGTLPNEAGVVAAMRASVGLPPRQ